MAKEPLEHLQAKACVEHLRGEGVPKAVEPIGPRNARLLKARLEALPDGAIGEGSPPEACKEGFCGLSRAEGQPG